MINYLEHKVSKDDIIKIFKKNIDRNIFIGNYLFFGSDENDNFYKELIERNISKHGFKIQEDMIELSILLKFFNQSFLNEIRKIIYSRRKGLIKLVCLDWLYCFYQDISEAEFISINEYILMNSTYDLLKVQSILNILLLRSDNKLIDDLIMCFTETSDSAVFYRFINGLDTRQLSAKFANETLNDVKMIVKSKIEISIDQRNEIIEKLSIIYN